MPDKWTEKRELWTVMDMYLMFDNAFAYDIKGLSTVYSSHCDHDTEKRYWPTVYVPGHYERLAWEAPTNGLSNSWSLTNGLCNSGSLWRTITDRIARANKLDYTVAALKNRKCIKSMTYMIAVIYEFDLRIYVIQYDTWSLYGIWMFMCDGVIHWVATHVNRKIFPGC